MSRRVCVSILLLAFGLVFGCAGQVHAGKLEVSAHVDSDTVFLGDSFTLRVEISGDDLAEPPGQPDIGGGFPGFAVEPLGMRETRHSPIAISGGQVVKADEPVHVFSFRLTPESAGRLTIPPLSVRAGSKTLHTEPIAVQVSEPEQSDRIRIAIGLSKPRVYIGEPLLLTVTCDVEPEIGEICIDVPAARGDGVVLRAPPGNGSGPDRREIELNGRKAEAEVEPATGAKKSVSIILKRLLIPAGPGDFSLDAVLRCKTLAGLSISGKPLKPFDNFFDDAPAAQRKKPQKAFISQSAPVSLTVLPLPEADRPKHFSGLLGKIHVEPSASPASVSPGEPVSLTVVVSGFVNPAPPDLDLDAIMPGLQRYFKVQDESARREPKEGSLTFSRTIRTKDGYPAVIPAAKIAYFDPEAGVYSMARSDPIPLNIKKAGPSVGAGPPPVGEDVRRFQGIASNYEGPEILSGRCSSIKCLLASWPAAAGLAAPPCLFLLLAGFKRRKQWRSSAEFRSRAALGRFEKVAKGFAGCPAGGADDCGQLLCAVRSFLGDKLMVRTSGFTRADFGSLLQCRGIDALVLVRLEQIWAICERERFGGGSATPLQWKELVGEALDIVRNVDRQVG
jgi:hypothetical protein